MNDDIPNDQTAIQPPAPVSSINIAVAQRLIQACPALPLQHVIDRLAEAEIKKRADALFKAVQASDDCYRQFAKMNRPDVIGYDSGRKIISEAFSKQRLDEVEKVQKKLSKIEKAVGRATAAKPDYSELLSLNLNDGDGNTQAGPAAS